jgi:hypothetical protein
LTWWTSYALSSAEDVVDGQRVPRSWDQPHAFKGLLGYRWPRGLSLSLAATAHTGWPTTPTFATVTTNRDGEEEIVETLGPRNPDRFETYLRFDAGIRREIPFSRGGGLVVAVDVLNLTDRDNACCVDDFVTEQRPDGSVAVRPIYEHWLGFTPLVSLTWTFGEGARSSGGFSAQPPSNE